MRTIQPPNNHQEHINHPIRALVFTLIVLVFAMMISAAGQLAQRSVDGKEVFNRVCATCHQVDPPASMMGRMQQGASETMSDGVEMDKPIAPPMSMIASRYLAAHETAEEAARSIETWLEGPSEDKSLMPAMAIQEHGLMPPVVLTEEERVAVAAYVLTLGSDEVRGRMQGMMNGQHNMNGMKADSTRGMMHRMMPDSTKGMGMGKMKHNN